MPLVPASIGDSPLISFLPSHFLPRGVTTLDFHLLLRPVQGAHEGSHCRSHSESAVCSRWLAAIHRLCFETASVSHIPPSQSVRTAGSLRNWRMGLGCGEQDLSVYSDGPKSPVSLWPTVVRPPCGYCVTSNVRAPECVSLRKGCCHLSPLSPLCPW